MIAKALIDDFNNMLKYKNLTIFCAESITAGLLASTIASVSGASSVLKGSVVTYDADLKIKLLGVPPEIIAINTAESQETTDAMCMGIRQLYPGVSIYVAITGVASKPTNDYTINKQVGQIYISVFYDKLYQYQSIILPNDSGDSRNQIRDEAVECIMEFIKKLIV